MAKENIKDNGFFYLLWGWLVLVASMGEYALTVWNYPYYFLPWLVLMPLGVVISFIYGYKYERVKKVKTYFGKLMGYLWGSFSISLFIILVFSIPKGISPVPYILVVNGLAVFVSGGMLRFKPLLIGGVLFWLLSVFSFFIPAEYHLLLNALGMLCSYIIPGYILKAGYRE